MSLVVAESPRARAVASSEQVEIHYKSSPAGFTLRENDLRVEPGYQHVILGEVKVRTSSVAGRLPGHCDRWPPGQKDVFATMQQGAYERGANAVIYAYSSVSQKSEFRECADARKANDFGGGWAVIVVPGGGQQEAPRPSGQETEVVTPGVVP